MEAKAMTQAIIIGAGMSGLLAAIKLGQAGFDEVVLLERNAEPGGTWADNVYPGAGCDVPSHLYSYSFALNPGWTRLYARQSEILAYFKDVARRFGVDGKIVFEAEVRRARFSEPEACWTVEAADGRQWRAPLLIVATGQLNQPAWGAVPGRERFRGAQMHSARWDASIELRKKRVGVIGTGASAVQLVPAIAPRPERLTVFQRAPNFIVPRNDKPIAEWQKRLYAHAPATAKLMRGLIYAQLEANWRAIAEPGGKRARYMEKLAREHLAEQVKDAALRARLTPDYPIGCKRILVSDDFYPALQRPNVDFETRAIAQVEEAGVRLADDTLVPLDVLIWATGFATQHFVLPIAVEGLGGRNLADAWANGPVAYRGMAVSGFPNMFLLYGPNTNLGHNSIIFMVERAVDYLLAPMKTVLREGGWIDAKASAQAAWDAQIQRELGTTAWAAGCDSWYKEGGRIANNWSGSTRRWARELKHWDADAWHRVRPVRTAA